MKLTYFFIFLSFLSLKAQDSLIEYRPLTKTGLDKEYFISGLKDAIEIPKAPFRWKGKQWIAFAGVAVGTMGLMIIDDEIQSVVQRNRTDISNSISTYGFEPWGNWYSVGTIGAFYLQGLIWQNDRSKRTALLSAKSLVLAAIFTRIPKYAFQRHRPSATDNPYIFEGPFGSYKHTAFVSGHTTAAFSIATIIASEYRKEKWVAPISYTIASLAGLSRIHDNKHWASDVLAGAALGYAIGKLVYNMDNWGIRIVPVSLVGGIGLTASLNIQ